MDKQIIYITVRCKNDYNSLFLQERHGNDNFVKVCVDVNMSLWLSVYYIKLWKSACQILMTSLE